MLVGVCEGGGGGLGWGEGGGEGGGAGCLGYQENIFLFFIFYFYPQKHMLWYSLEAPQ